MVTYIEIISGVGEGSRYEVKAGLTMGRYQTDIEVKDPKVSSLHARFEVDPKGQFVLLDLDSSNGIHISGRRVKKVALLPGVVFELGRTQFKVFQVDEQVASEFNRIVTWREMLKEQITTLSRLDRPLVQGLQSFSPALRLVFIQGVQTDQEIILGYGPRKAGSVSLDIQLLDGEAPQEAFEIHPHIGTAQIQLKSGRVKLNDKFQDLEILKEGDLISFGSTVIRVQYL